MKVGYCEDTCQVSCMFHQVHDFSQIGPAIKTYFRKTIRVSKSLDPDQARQIAGPDREPSCSQSL